MKPAYTLNAFIEMTAYYKKIIFDNRIHFFISESFCLV